MLVDCDSRPSWQLSDADWHMAWPRLSRLTPRGDDVREESCWPDVTDPGADRGNAFGGKSTILLGGDDGAEGVQAWPALGEGGGGRWLTKLP